MAKEEFILLIPAIIYGVGIVDLLKVFRKDMYWEAALWGVFVLIAIVVAWVELYEKLTIISGSIYSLLMIIVQAIFYAKIATVLTPEEKDTDSKLYFESIYKNLFYLISAGVVFNLIVNYSVYMDQRPVWFRLIGVVVPVTVALTNNKLARRGMLLLFLALALFVLLRRGGVI